MVTRDRLLEVAAQYSTPAYVYDLHDVAIRHDELAAALPARSTLLFSLKANPLPPLAGELRARGAHAEVSSLGELAVALAAGFSGDQLLYTGPGKSRAEIDHAVASGVTLFSCESPADLSRLRAAAVDSGRRLDLLLRLQPDRRAAVGLSMSDGRQFGFEEPDAVAAAGAVAADDAFGLRGFHVFLGSQADGVEALVSGFSCAREAIQRVVEAAGVACEVADLGGGFPWPVATAGDGASLDGLAAALDDLVAGWPGGAPEQLWFESGRRLCGAAGWLLATVVDVKRRSGGPTIVVLDAGINTFGGMTGLGRVLRPRVEPENLDAPLGADAEPADLVGPLCTPLDRVAVQAMVPRPRVGDRLAIPNVGAYGATASLSAFLSRSPATEVVLDTRRPDPMVGAWRLRHGHEPLADDTANSSPASSPASTRWASPATS